MSFTERDNHANADAAVADIVQRLIHRRDSVRKEAERQLATLGPEYSAALVAEAAKNAGWRTDRRLPSLAVGFAIMFSSALAFTILFPWERPVDWWRQTCISLLRSLAVTVPTFYLVFRPIFRRGFRSLRLERLAPALPRIDDARVLPSLVAVWPLTDGQIREAVEANLARQAAPISGEQWDSMGSDDRENLAALLASDSFASANPSVVTALLSAIARHGGHRDMSNVGRLLRKATNPAIRQAASDCVTAIEARLEGRTDSSVLLRSSAGSADEESLLHPASGQTTDRQILLQPAGGGNETREQTTAVIPAGH